MQYKFTKKLGLSLGLILIISLFTFASVAASSTDVFINEIQVSTSSTDWEFFELYGTPGTDLSDLTLIGIESDNYYAAGTIDLVISLAGQSIPSDGFWLGMSPAGETAYGVSGEMSISNNSFENSTATYLLVKNFTGAKDDDVDTDNDGVLDNILWEVIVDAINLRDGDSSDFDYGFVSVGPDGSYLPSGTFRCSDGPWGTFGSNMHNFSAPDGTPGVTNGCGFAMVINEIQVSTSSTDWEFFELYGTPGTDLSDLTLIGIESDNYYAAGTIDLVISLAGQSIPSDGFWLGMSPAGETAYGVSGEMSISNNSFENSTATYLLVKNFTGAKDDDVDTDNDGVLDNILWEVIVDAINLRDGDSSDFDYGFVSVGPDGSYLPSGTFRCPDGPAGTFGSNMHNFSAPDGTPGVTNGCGGGPPVEACGDEYTPIYEVQGVGWSSPLDETVVSVEGVVVGDFQLGTQLKGFFVQDAAGDGDPATSDGVFVYDDDTDVSVGDHVRVKGEVDEFFSKTQITKVSSVLLCSSGNVVLPTPIVLPTANLEPFEGMLVMMDQPLYISEYYNYDWVGEMVLSTERQHQPTAMFAPGSPEGLDLADYNYSHRIILDDGSSLSSNPDFTRHPNGLEFTMDNRFRGGDILTGVTGALDYSFGAYKIQPTVGATYTEDNPRLLAPEDVGGEVKVASFNVLNYFTTLDDGVNDICGPLGDMECRGADTQEEFDRQKAKIVEAISIMDADIVGLMEIENNGTAVADLVQGLNDKMGEGTYAYVNTGEIGTDAITVAFIYQPAAVSLEGDFAVLDTPEFVNPMGYATDKNRPALAQTFGVTNGKNGVGVKTFTVVVNHFKSKGSSCGEGDDDPYAGSCNLTRTMAAMELLAWLDTKPTDARKNDFVIIGDLNSYDHEDPINVFLEADYTDLIKEFLGEEAYTYVFDGQLGYLDYALVDKKLANNVTGVTVWHINTDEPDLIDYDLTYKSYPQSLLYAIDPFRSSDHDPVIIGLALDNGKD